MWRSHCYATAALAHKIAEVKHRAHYKRYGDDAFVVVRAFGSSLRREDRVTRLIVFGAADLWAERAS